MTDDLTERVALGLDNLALWHCAIRDGGTSATLEDDRWAVFSSGTENRSVLFKGTWWDCATWLREHRARAAILETLRAIREPGDGVLEVGYEAFDYAAKHGRSVEDYVWQAMLDHLINQYEEQDG